MASGFLRVLLAGTLTLLLGLLALDRYLDWASSPRLPFDPAFVEDHTGAVYEVRVIYLDEGAVRYFIPVGHVELDADGNVVNFDGNRRQMVLIARQVLESVGER